MADFLDSSLMNPTAPREEEIIIKCQKEEKLPKPHVSHDFPLISKQKTKEPNTYRTFNYEDTEEDIITLEMLGNLNCDEDSQKKEKPFYKKRLKRKSKTLKALRINVLMNIFISFKNKVSSRTTDEENLLHKDDLIVEKSKIKSCKKKKKSKKKKVKKATMKSCQIVGKCMYAMSTAPNLYLQPCPNYDQQNIYKIGKVWKI